jgi:1-acyl-sn-glycerol-3-phosphate acyltransferase
MTFVRSLLFNLFFFVGTFLLTFVAVAIRFLFPGHLMGFARWWARSQVGAARVLCGIRVDVSGWENLPQGPVIIASRHESALDILIWLGIVARPCFVVKQELTKIPLFGGLILAVGMIAVDRSAGAKAMRALMEAAGRAAGEGAQIIIFPEGTRCEPGVFPPLQPGIVALAARTGLNIVPVGTDAGLCWSRKAFAKRAGTVHVKIHPPLPGTLPRAEIMEKLSAAFRG